MTDVKTADIKSGLLTRIKDGTHMMFYLKDKIICDCVINESGNLLHYEVNPDMVLCLNELMEVL